MTKLYCVDIPYFLYSIHSSIAGHVGGFHNLSIINKNLYGMLVGTYPEVLQLGHMVLLYIFSFFEESY